MTEVYLMPTGSEESLDHLDTTLVNPVKTTTLAQHLSPEQVAEIQNIYQDSDINVWGLEPGPGNIRSWEQFAADDIAIFVPSQDDLIITKITHKLRNADLARALWGTSGSGQTWELIFFVKIVGILQIGKRAILDHLGYDEKDVLMGNRRVTDRFYKAYHTLSNFINSYSDSEIKVKDFNQQTAEKYIDANLTKEEKLDQLKKKLDESDTTTDYVEVQGKRIKRNYVLVKYIKEKAGYKCEYCGFTFTKKDGSKYVEAIHIKALASSKMDTEDNMLALCPNHHKVLDKGTPEGKEDILRKCGKL